MTLPKPLILGIETSTDACSVALSGPFPTLQYFEVVPRGHAAGLLPMIRDLLAECDVRPDQLDAIAFAGGPGSFTGLRIAAGVAQGLAFALNKPVIRISTLAAMVAGLQRQIQGGDPHRVAADSSRILPASFTQAFTLQVIPLLDARMQEVYAGCYRLSGQGLAMLSPDRILAPEAVSAWSSCVAPLALIGSGLVYYDRLPAVLIAQAIWIEDTFYPEAAAVAELAVDDFIAGHLLRPEEAQPVYLRDEVAWQKIK